MVRICCRSLRASVDGPARKWHRHRNEIRPSLNATRSVCTIPSAMRSDVSIKDVSKPLELDPARAANNAAWWRDLAQRSSFSNKELFGVVQVNQLPGSIIQSNCTVCFYHLKLEDGRSLRVALKDVDLSKNKCVATSCSRFSANNPRFHSTFHGTLPTRLAFLLVRPEYPVNPPPGASRDTDRACRLLYPPGQSLKQLNIT